MQAPLQARNDSDAVQAKTARTATQERRLVDNRPTAVAQRELIEMLNNSPRVLQQRALSDAVHNSPRMVAQRHEMNTLFGGAVRLQGDRSTSAELSPAHRDEKPNNTGLPNQLKSGIESLSGMSMDHVKVHYNSDKPARLQAHAYARGAEIHVAPGQEQHLPHEAWHIVQQAQGRVRATAQMKKSVPVNDDAWLEREADLMGERAQEIGRRAGHADVGLPGALPPAVGNAIQAYPLQARWVVNQEDRIYFWEEEDKTLQTDAPSALASAGYALRTAPSPSSYSVDRGGRGRPLYYSIDQWIDMNGSSSSRTSNDVYNPFGRFDATATEVAYIPAPQFSDEQREALLTRLRERMGSLQTVGKTGPIGPHGYPLVIQSAGGTGLFLIGVSAFGALYGPQPQHAGARCDPSAERSAALLHIVAAAPEWKIVENLVTAVDVRCWSGRDRKQSQLDVMGSSAADAAENAGYDRNEGLGWEWLHLIAHSMGGVKTIGPQVALNLVAGTSECNSQMIVVEEWIKAVIVGGGHRARMFVAAHLSDQVRHIADRIVYDFVILDAKDQPIDAYHWEFNPLSRTQPLVEENRGLRYAARTLLIGKTGKDVSGKGHFNAENCERELNSEGYRVGRASGNGNMCLLDTLSQLLAQRGHNVSTDYLVAFFANAGVVQLGEMIDVYNINVTTAIAADFNVGVQVHQAQYHGIQHHPVVGAGPVLHIYLAGAQFSPLWPGEAPPLPPDTAEFADETMDGGG